MSFPLTRTQDVVCWAQHKASGDTIGKTNGCASRGRPALRYVEVTWYNELHRIGINCAFDVITTDESYRDHLVSSVLDESPRQATRER